MSVARRGESGAASASSYWRLSQRRIQSSGWAAAAAGRRGPAAAGAPRCCGAAEARGRRWVGAARASRNSAVSSGPIITRAAKPPIAATTRTTAIPIANISYNNIGSPPPLAVGTKPLAYSLKFHFQRENAKRHRHSPRHGRKLKPNGSLFSRTLNTLTLCRVPDTRENLWRGAASLRLLTSASDAVDGSSTGTEVPWMWVLLRPPRLGGAKYANGQDDRSRYC